MVEAIPADGTVRRKCCGCGEYFEDMLWNGNYLCPDCRGGWGIDDQRHENVPAEASYLPA